MHALVAFDLDDTLTPSKCPIEEPLAGLLARLTERTGVCIISGGMLSQFMRQVIDHLDLSERGLSHLHLMPTCGTRYVRYEDGQWRELYSHTLSEDQRTRARAAIERHARAQGVWAAHTWGAPIEDRGSQITYSALGQQAPREAKSAWDPDGVKRAHLARAIAADLPDLSVHSGGATSVDITLRGVDKAYGIRHLMEYTGLSPADLLFFGDRLDPDGNDYPVISTGVECVPVRDWRDTADRVARLLSGEGV